MGLVEDIFLSFLEQEEVADLFLCISELFLGSEGFPAATSALFLSSSTSSGSLPDSHGSTISKHLLFKTFASLERLV